VFNKRGMAMEAGSCWFLPRLVGMQQAQEWVMTAELFGAEGRAKGLAGDALIQAPGSQGTAGPRQRRQPGEAVRRQHAPLPVCAAVTNSAAEWSEWGAGTPLETPRDASTLQCVGYLGRRRRMP
jgi:hypothetical protein